MGHGGYDYPQPTSPYHDGSSTVPSTIFIGQQQDMDGEGDVSLVSSAWSSLEFDDMSDM